jgi:hypothetical protein
METSIQPLSASSAWVTKLRKHALFRSARNRFRNYGFFWGIRTSGVSHILRYPYGPTRRIHPIWKIKDLALTVATAIFLDGVSNSHQTKNMKRRNFLKLTAAAGALLSAGGWLSLPNTARAQAVGG